MYLLFHERLELTATQKRCWQKAAQPPYQQPMDDLPVHKQPGDPKNTLPYWQEGNAPWDRQGANGWQNKEGLRTGKSSIKCRMLIKLTILYLHMHMVYILVNKFTFMVGYPTAVPEKIKTN
jgi:hypothetical protein